jgi:hypothetical protein
MRRNLVMSAAIAILSTASLVSIDAQAGPAPSAAAAKPGHEVVAVHPRHHARTTRQAIRQSSDITSFSSSSALNVGTNHPPKK